MKRKSNGTTNHAPCEKSSEAPNLKSGLRDEPDSHAKAHPVSREKRLALHALKFNSPDSLIRQRIWRIAQIRPLILWLSCRHNAKCGVQPHDFVRFYNLIML